MPGARLAFVQDSETERGAIEISKFDVAIFERSSAGAPLFNVSTLHNGFSNPLPEGWSWLYNGGEHGIKRFAVAMHKDELKKEIEKVYGSIAV